MAAPPAHTPSPIMLMTSSAASSARAGALAAAEKRGQCLWRVACGKERLCREHASRHSAGGPRASTPLRLMRASRTSCPQAPLCRLQAQPTTAGLVPAAMTRRGRPRSSCSACRKCEVHHLLRRSLILAPFVAKFTDLGTKITVFELVRERPHATSQAHSGARD